jgi:hypothetical protein
MVLDQVGWNFTRTLKPIMSLLCADGNKRTISRDTEPIPVLGGTPTLEHGQTEIDALRYYYSPSTSDSILMMQDIYPQPDLSFTKYYLHTPNENAERHVAHQRKASHCYLTLV